MESTPSPNVISNAHKIHNPKSTYAIAMGKFKNIWSRSAITAKTKSSALNIRLNKNDSKKPFISSRPSYILMDSD